jgi:hypothetical protein
MVAQAKLFTGLGDFEKSSLMTTNGPRAHTRSDSLMLFIDRTSNRKPSMGRPESRDGVSELAANVINIQAPVRGEELEQISLG